MLLKVLYISVPPFFDMDLSMVSNLSKFCDVSYLIDMPPHYQSASAFRVNEPKEQPGIYSVNEFPDLHKFANYIPLDKSFIISRTSGKTYALSNLKLQKTIADHIDKINPDVIHCGHFVHEYFYYFLLTNKRKIVLTIHDPFPHSGEHSRRKELNRRINYFFIKDVILLNRAQKDAFTIRNKGKFRHIFLSRLGVYEYLRDYKTASKKDDKFRLLFFGRISPYKGINILLTAFEKFGQKHPDAELVIAGNGKFSFDILKFTNNLQIKILNRYISNSELVELITQSSLIVCPYLDATQSGTVMSAFALNKPVLATNVGGLPEMIDDEYTGFLLPPNNAELLYEKLSFIFENQDILKQMELLIEKEYNSGDKSWREICLELTNFYKKL